MIRTPGNLPGPDRGRPGEWLRVARHCGPVRGDFFDCPERAVAAPAEGTKVSNDDTGAASSLVNVGQQIGGSIGLAIVGTVAWSAVASSLRSQAAAAARAGVHATGARAAAVHTGMYDHALATGFSRGYLVSAAVLALAVIIALAVIRVTRQDLSGADPMSEPAGDTTHQSRA